MCHPILLQVALLARSHHVFRGPLKPPAARPMTQPRQMQCACYRNIAVPQHDLVTLILRVVANLIGLIGSRSCSCRCHARFLLQLVFSSAACAGRFMAENRLELFKKREKPEPPTLRHSSLLLPKQTKQGKNLLILLSNCTTARQFLRWYLTDDGPPMIQTSSPLPLASEFFEGNTKSSVTAPEFS